MRYHSQFCYLHRVGILWYKVRESVEYGRSLFKRWVARETPMSPRSPSLKGALFMNLYCNKCGTLTYGEHYLQQKNGTLHLCAYCFNYRFRYLKYIPNLDIPKKKSKPLLEKERKGTTQRREELPLFKNR